LPKATCVTILLGPTGSCARRIAVRRASRPHRPAGASRGVLCVANMNERLAIAVTVSVGWELRDRRSW
jgi:hypothetical protein